MDPVALLEPRSEDAPSGENLEYDPVFVEMELAAQPGEETQIGDTVTEGSDPEYAEVIEKGLEVLERSHDLRAAVYIGEALLATEGLTGFAKVTTYVKGCLEQHWATCHPELDEDDDDDPTMRINTMRGFCGAPGGESGPSPIYRALRRAPLSESRGFGRFSMRDIEIAEGLIQAPEDMANIPDTASVAAAFRDSDESVVAERLEAAKTILDDLKAISAVFDTETPGRGPELDPVIKQAHQIHKTINNYAGGGDAVDAAEDDDAGEFGDAGGAVSSGAPAGTVAVGGLRSPADVANALDRIIEYYQRNEPSSPLPIILKRAKRLVNADFMTIMKDLAPGGIDNVRMVSGSDDE